MRGLHSLSESAVAAGRADVTAAANPVAWFLRWVAGLPQAGRDVQVTVAFHPAGRGCEKWERHFGSRRYATSCITAAGSNAMQAYSAYFTTGLSSAQQQSPCLRRGIAAALSNSGFRSFASIRSINSDVSYRPISGVQQGAPLKKPAQCFSLFAYYACFAASTAVRAVMFTMRRTVLVLVRM